jgi:glucose-6-phosphate isomerase|tara:strand:+ start:813 stop:1973 length:1161 start_codon:yes stop_codon:yes gene_type:complete
MDANLIIKNFNSKLKLKDQKKLSDYLKKINNLEWPKFFKSYKKNYNYSYDKKFIQKYKHINNINIIGMGGSSLGCKAIYNFLINKIKKKLTFSENLILKKKNKKKSLNIIISKSGNTLETIVNFNSQFNKKDKNIFITEKSNNYLEKLANKLKSDVVEHKNFIGGRFSVLSEVGMLPAELMGLKESQFKQFNNLITKKKFLKNLVNNVLSTYQFVKTKKFNSVILNYDPNSEDFFKWYQQLVSESLGKNSKGIFPIISTMPKDNHSILQLYLSGFKSNFYTFFIVEEKNSSKLNPNLLTDNLNFLKQKNIFQILNSQRIATENIFRLKKIPFRSFYIKKRSEKTLGKLFCFFTLEVILLSHLLKVNPLDQPEVELIKKETFKILKK